MPAYSDRPCRLCGAHHLLNEFPVRSWVNTPHGTGHVYEWSQYGCPLRYTIVLDSDQDRHSYHPCQLTAMKRGAETEAYRALPKVLISPADDTVSAEAAPSPQGHAEAIEALRADLMTMTWSRDDWKRCEEIVVADRTAWIERHAALRVEFDRFRAGIAAAFRKHGLAPGPEAVDALVRERDALKKFKDFAHRRLDEMDIPTHPDGPHSKEGCRIGDRLDIVQQRIAAPARPERAVTLLPDDLDPTGWAAAVALFRDGRLGADHWSLTLADAIRAYLRAAPTRSGLSGAILPDHLHCDRPGVYWKAGTGSIIDYTADELEAIAGHMRWLSRAAPPRAEAAEGRAGLPPGDGLAEHEEPKR